MGVDKHGSTGSGKAALMHYADLCYLTKNYDEAIKAYNQALDEFGDKTEFLKKFNNFEKWEYIPTPYNIARENVILLSKTVPSILPSGFKVI